MQSWSSKDFTADRAWGALDIANFSGTTVRLHWTDQPYIWHINDGQEVFGTESGPDRGHWGAERICAAPGSATRTRWPRRARTTRGTA